MLVIDRVIKRSFELRWVDDFSHKLVMTFASGVGAISSVILEA
jgi:hypothetical protein